jgi:hypothetical protein
MEPRRVMLAAVHPVGTRRVSSMVFPTAIFPDWLCPAPIEAVKETAGKNMGL